jgi:hypothetical protein
MACLRRQLESISCGPIFCVGARAGLLEEVSRMKPDLLILLDDWAAVLDPEALNGQAASALLLLTPGRGRRRKGVGAQNRDPFRTLVHPATDDVLRLQVAGALQAFQQRRQARERQRHFAALASIVSDYAYSVIVLPNGQMVREWSTGTLEAMTGFSEEELDAQGGWRALVYPEDIPLAEAQLRILQGGQEDDRRLRIVARDGTVRWVRHRGRAERDRETGRIARIVIAMTDVTSEQFIGRALRESEERWKFALEASGDAVWDWDVESGEVYHSDRWRQLTGSSEEAPARAVSEWMERVHPDDRKRFTENIRRYFRGVTPEYETEYRLRGAGGTYLWVLDRAKIVSWTPDGKPKRVIGSMADITTRKEDADRLARTNAFLRDILESSPTVAIISTDQDGIIRFWNSGAERILGREAASVVGADTLSAVLLSANEEARRLEEDVRSMVLADAQTISRIVAVSRHDGSDVWMRMTISPRLDAGGSVKGLLAIGEDLTSQVEAQAVSRRRERELRLLAFTLNCAREGFCITDLRYRILYVNESLRLTYGYGEDELLGQSVRVLQAPGITRETLRSIDVQTRHGGWSGEIPCRRKDGREFPAEVSIAVVRNDDGEPVALVSVARDITERVAAAERIRSSLAEKEVMLKEIHHRVKNNLQVISSLLNLQSAQEQDPATVAALKESQGRVRSMALVHEELYRSTDLADIDMASYVRKLTNNLFFAYQPAGTRVTLDIDVHDVYLPVDAAVPCGLIINELISNSLKYAFRKRSKGAITVRFQREGDSFRLMVGDDGVGLPLEVDIEHSESLGLQLVSILAKQLRATLEVSRSQGTSFALSFVSHSKHAHA